MYFCSVLSIVNCVCLYCGRVLFPCILSAWDFNWDVSFTLFILPTTAWTRTTPPPTQSEQIKSDYKVTSTQAALIEKIYKIFRYCASSMQRFLCTDFFSPVVTYVCFSNSLLWKRNQSWQLVDRSGNISLVKSKIKGASWRSNLR